MFTKKYVKHGHLLIRHAEKLVRYRRDVFTEIAITDFDRQIGALRQSLKERDEAKAKEESDRLHDLYTKYLPAPKDASWRENVEVILVAAVCGILSWRRYTGGRGLRWLYRFAMVMLIVSVPIHLRTLVTWNTDYVRVFPAWYSAIEVPTACTYRPSDALSAVLPFPNRS